MFYGATEMKQLSVVKGSSFLDSSAISARVYAIVQLTERSASTMKGIVAEWSRRAKSRNDLARMNSHMLQDIGLERAEVQREINKPFWKK